MSPVPPLDLVELDDDLALPAVEVLRVLPYRRLAALLDLGEHLVHDLTPAFFTGNTLRRRLQRRDKRIRLRPAIKVEVAFIALNTIKLQAVDRVADFYFNTF